MPSAITRATAGRPRKLIASGTHRVPGDGTIAVGDVLEKGSAKLGVLIDYMEVGRHRGMSRSRVYVQRCVREVLSYRQLLFQADILKVLAPKSNHPALGDVKGELVESCWCERRQLDSLDLRSDLCRVEEGENESVSRRDSSPNSAEAMTDSLPSAIKEGEIKIDSLGVSFVALALPP